MDDRVCIEEVRAGRTERFAVLVERYQDRVHALVSRMVSDRDTVSDLAQEVFLLAFRGLRGFQGDASFSTWLCRIAVNVCRSEYRRRRRHGRLGAYGFGRVGDSEEAPDLEPVDTGNLPLDRLEREEGVRLLDEALASLDEESRELLVLREFQGLSYQELAEVLGCPVGTVRSRLFRARAILRERLERAMGGTEK